MLKIKDNVDLKELEKFGFRYTEFEDWHIFHNDIEVSLGDNRELIIENGSGYAESIEVYYCSELIYELTKADLVEKVDD